MRTWELIGTALGRALYYGVADNDTLGDIYTSDEEPTETGLFATVAEARDAAAAAWNDFTPAGQGAV